MMKLNYGGKNPEVYFTGGFNLIDVIKNNDNPDLQEALINFKPSQDITPWVKKYSNVIKGFTIQNVNGKHIIEVEIMEENVGM